MRSSLNQDKIHLNLKGCDINNYFDAVEICMFFFIIGVCTIKAQQDFLASILYKPLANNYL